MVDIQARKEGDLIVVDLPQVPRGSGGISKDEQRTMGEPVAYINVTDRTLEWAKPTRWETPTVVKMDKVPLYLKKKWVGLTDDEIKDILDCKRGGLVDIKKAEAKLKEKNCG